MDEDSHRLSAAWDRHSAETLDSYLIQHVENPCINPQSVLLRGLLIDALFPERFTELIRQEMRYAACAMTCLLAHAGRWSLKASTAEGGAPGCGVSPLDGPIDLLRSSIDHGIDIVDLEKRLQQAMQTDWRAFTSPFEHAWRERLAGAPAAGCSVLELACGSANDARYYARYGLDRLIAYTGIDICGKNVRNAARHLAGGRLICGDAQRLPLADRSHDYVFACDLLEHLSERGIERVVGEAARVARKEIWWSLFNAEWQPAHTIEPTSVYHWNVLSLEELQQVLRNRGFRSYVVDISTEWERAFPGYRHYNPRARLIVSMREGR